jgi:hypothetical protein
MSKTVSKVLNKYSKKTRMRSSKKTKHKKKTRMRSSKKTKKPKKTKRVRSSKRKLKSVKKRRLRNTIIKSMKGGVGFEDIELAPASVDTSVLKYDGDYLLRECSPDTLKQVRASNKEHCTLVLKIGTDNYGKIIEYDTNTNKFYFIYKKTTSIIPQDVFNSLTSLLEHYKTNYIPHTDKDKNKVTTVKLINSKQPENTYEIPEKITPQIKELLLLLESIKQQIYTLRTINKITDLPDAYSNLTKLYFILYKVSFTQRTGQDNLNQVISSISHKIDTSTHEQIQIMLTILKQVKQELDKQ